MSDQNRKNAQPSPSENESKNAYGIDDIDEGEDRVEQDNARKAGGGRQAENEESDSSDGR